MKLFSAKSDNSKMTIKSFQCVQLQDETLEIVGYFGSDTVLSIPRELKKNLVTSIGIKAFCGKTMISVTIPDSVIRIEDYAFSDCAFLTSITIPNSVTSLGRNVFCGCDLLASITIPNGVTSIEDNAFKDCSSLTNIVIPNGLTSIGDNAFSGCSSLTNITIPESVIKIGYNAFSYCSSLMSLFISQYAVNHFRQLFYDINNDSVKEIMIMPGVTEIKCRTFENANVRSISLPNSITTIGYRAFQMCKYLQKMYIPDSIKRIDCCAFMMCSSLAEIIIPDSVEYIGDDAFTGCSLISITIMDGSRKRYIFNNITEFEQYIYKKNHANKMLEDGKEIISIDNDSYDIFDDVVANDLNGDLDY